MDEHEDGMGARGAGVDERAGDEAAREKHVPVSEAIRQRKRAQEAESRLAALGDRLSEMERDLTTAREALDASERGRRIDAALVEADAVDLETARLLTEMAVAQMDEPDVRLAVEELRRKKGFLFHRRRAGTGAATGSIAAPVRERVVDAVRAAAESGDRSALLAYLRARRNGV